MAASKHQHRMAETQNEHAKRIAEHRLKHIQQNGTIRTYIDELMEIALVLLWSDAPLMAAF